MVSHPWGYPSILPRHTVFAKVGCSPLNLIAGDGQTNVLHLNTLDYELWDEVTEQGVNHRFGHSD
jgi:hypothetical protein